MNIYDFDKTLFYTDSSYKFLRYCLFHHPKLLFTYFPRLVKAIFKYGLNEKSQAVGYTLIKYLNNYEKDITRFWDKNEKKISEWYLKHKKDDDMIISASPNYVIDEIARRLKIKSIATTVDYKTGEVIGEIKHAKEKALYLINNGFPFIDEFYSDSFSDTPAALLAEKAFLVKHRGKKVIPWPNMQVFIKKFKRRYLKKK